MALLLAQSGGAHLHLCLDGSEPPVSLHLTDAHHHADHHGGHHASGESHSDLDVPLAGDLLSKPAKLGLDLPIIVLAALWLALLARPLERLRPRDPPRRFASSRHLRLPPLRGPPLPAS